jgi:hypothetical protein
MTAAQLELIACLVREAIDDPLSLDGRWKGAAPHARAYAERGQLLLRRDWTADLVLSAAGEVVVIDTENGEPPSPATAWWSRVALFAAIGRYPELLSLLPARPVEAATCVGCHGTGVPPVRFTNVNLRGVICVCGGAGWTLPDDARGDEGSDG